MTFERMLFGSSVFRVVGAMFDIAFCAICSISSSVSTLLIRSCM